MRILVTGSRDWEDQLAVSEAIHNATGGDIQGLTIVYGHCPTGADHFADMLAWRLGLHPERHPANWSGPCRSECPPGHRREGRYPGVTYCPKAGHYRNQDMVDLGADIVLAFQRNRSRGTQDCIDRARAAGLKVTIWGEHADPPP
jgi:hypothetical protein